MSNICELKYLSSLINNEGEKYNPIKYYRDKSGVHIDSDYDKENAASNKLLYEFWIEAIGVINKVNSDIGVNFRFGYFGKYHQNQLLDSTISVLRRIDESYMIYEEMANEPFMLRQPPRDITRTDTKQQH